MCRRRSSHRPRLDYLRDVAESLLFLLADSGMFRANTARLLMRVRALFSCASCDQR
jgi:hypothetical protein